MDHDDPERRIAGLQRGQAGVWAPQPSSFRSFLALERQQRFPKWGWLGVVVLAVGMFVLVGVGVHDLHQYRSGTPVLATGHPLVGSRMDVRVMGDDAYAATSGRAA